MNAAEGGMSGKKLSGVFLILGVVALSIALTMGNFFGGGGGGGADKIRWSPIAGSIEAARSGKKLLFYDFSAAWCPPCRMMEQMVFSDAELADTISTRFVPVHVIDRMREEGRNPAEIEALQQRFQIDSFPTVLIATADGAECARFVGFRSKDRVAEFVNSALSASGQD